MSCILILSMLSKTAPHNRVSLKLIKAQTSLLKASMQNIRTLRQLEERQEKEQFFEEIIDEVDLDLESEQKEMLFEKLEYASNLKKIKQKQSHTSKHISLASKDNIKHTRIIKEEPFLMAIDSKVFAEVKKQRMMMRLPTQKEERTQKIVPPIMMKRFQSTVEEPTGKVSQKLRMMDKTMNEQFRKVQSRQRKHRRFASNGDWCKIRASLDENKLESASKVTNYHQATSSVPNMLLGDLLSVPQRKRSSKVSDDRLKCLLSDSRLQLHKRTYRCARS